MYTGKITVLGIGNIGLNLAKNLYNKTIEYSILSKIFYRTCPKNKGMRIYTKKIGVLGLGNIGLGIAQNLHKKGLHPIGIDIAPDRLELFASLGGQTSSNLGEIATSLDILLVCLVSDAQIKAVFSDEILALFKKSVIIVVMSTVPVHFIQSFSKSCQAYGLEVLDAPVSGGQVGAEQGSLSVFSAGSSKALERVQHVLNAIGQKIYHFGEEPGLGSKYKIVHQLLAGIHIVAAAEALALAKKSGLDLDLFYDVVNHSGGQSWLFTDRVPRMIAQDYTAKSEVNIFVKDLALALQLAQESGLDSALGALSLEQFQRTAAAGLAQKDDSSVVELYFE